MSVETPSNPALATLNNPGLQPDIADDVAQSPPRASLKRLALSGAGWTMAGYGFQQAMRLGSNLVLTRLLFPEAFGLMALVSLFMQALAMFSDIGTGPAILRDPRGDDPAFLQTAFTLQVIRGAAITLVSCALAYPLAALYQTPSLITLLPVAAVSATIAGFQSTKAVQALRHMRLFWVTLLETLSTTIAILTTILIAAVHPSVWSLVWGGVLGALVRTILSHILLPGQRDGFGFDRECAGELFRFGRWIFLSSVISFAAQRLDQGLLGALVPMEVLGVYAIAMSLAEVPIALNMILVRRVMAPAVSLAVRETPEQVASLVDKFRSRLDLLFLPATGLLMGAGTQLVRLIYDHRYHAAGWILQAFCLRIAMRCVLEPADATLVAFGRPHYAMVQNLVRLTWIAVMLPVGWFFGGIGGFVIGGALSECLVFPVLWLGLARIGALDVRRELKALGLFVGAVATACLVVHAIS